MLIRMKPSAISALIGGIALAAAAITGGILGDAQGAGPDPDPAAHPVVTIQVVDETYKVELITPELVETAEGLLAGEIDPRVPNGMVVRDDPGPNAPWSWHIDPTTFEWAEMTTEVCDGLPSFVEEDTVTSPYYCPWDATVIAID
jgi:hypothetical protein